MRAKLICILILQIAAVACWVISAHLDRGYLELAEHDGFLMGFDSGVTQISEYLDSKGLIPEGARLATGELPLRYPDPPQRDYNDLSAIYTIVKILAWVLSFLAAVVLLIEVCRKPRVPASSRVDR